MATQQTCSRCLGSGTDGMCLNCVGQGTVHCPVCYPVLPGSSSKHACLYCIDNERVECSACNGTGKAKCSRCFNSRFHSNSRSHGWNNVDLTVHGLFSTWSLVRLAFVFLITLWLFNDSCEGRGGTSNYSSKQTERATQSTRVEREENQRPPHQPDIPQSRALETTSRSLLLWMTSGIRPEPSDDSPILEWAPEGTRLEWRSKVGEYYEVVYKNYIVYVKENLVDPKYRKITNPLESGPLNGVVVTRRPSRLWARPSTRARVNVQIPRGVVLRVFAESSAFYRVSYRGQVGFIKKDATDPNYR